MTTNFVKFHKDDNVIDGVNVGVSAVTGLTVYCPNIDLTFEVPCGRGKISFTNVEESFRATYKCVCGRVHTTKIS